MTEKPKRIRKGIPITSHKGGRTARISAVVTPEIKTELMKTLDRNEESLGDWITRKLQEDKLYIA